MGFCPINAKGGIRVSSSSILGNRHKKVGNPCSRYLEHISIVQYYVENEMKRNTKIKSIQFSGWSRVVKYICFIVCVIDCDFHRPMHMTYAYMKLVSRSNSRQSQYVNGNYSCVDDEGTLELTSMNAKMLFNRVQDRGVFTSIICYFTMLAKHFAKIHYVKCIF